MKVQKLIFSLCLCMAVNSVFAANKDMKFINVAPAQQKAVIAAIDRLSKEVGRKIPITEVSPAPVPGMLQVTSDLNVFFITTTGDFAFFGELINTNKDKSNFSLTENAAKKLRMAALNAIKSNNMIIFPATKQKIGAITVFTDIDCPYCRHMQELVPEYNSLGIEVRYLSFPRTGPKTQSFDEAIKVWCAKDKAKAYNTAVTDHQYPKDTCVKNPVMDQFELGQKMGVNGTPTIILDDGTKLPGIVPPKELVKIIKEHK